MLQIASSLSGKTPQASASKKHNEHVKPDNVLFEGGAAEDDDGGGGGGEFAEAWNFGPVTPAPYTTLSCSSMTKATRSLSTTQRPAQVIPA